MLALVRNRMSTSVNSSACNADPAKILTATLPNNDLMVQFTNSSDSIKAYAFVMDSETAVYVEPGNAFGLLRLKKANAGVGDVGYCAPG